MTIKFKIKNHRQPLGFIFKRLFVFSILAITISCSSNKKEVLKEMDKLEELLTTETAEDIEITYTDSGYLKTKLTSPRAISKRGNDNPYTEMPEGLHADFYNKYKEIESTIDAKYGISYENEHKIILRNDVDVLNTSNERLNTEELIWNQITRKIYTEKFVKITTPNEILTGYGMEADEDFSHWVIKKASGEFNLD